MKRFLIFILALTLVNSSLPYAISSPDGRNNPSGDGATTEQPTEETLETLREQSEGIKEDQTAETEKAKEDLDLAFQAAAILEENVSKLQSNLSDEQIDERISKDDIFTDIPGVGRIQYTQIVADVDGFKGQLVRVPRIIFEATQDAIMIIDENKISRESKHLRQYIARNHHMSGKRTLKDENGKIIKGLFGPKMAIGRNLKIAFVKADSVQVEEKPRLKTNVFSSKWWASYWTAVYKKPSQQDVSFAVLFNTVIVGPLTALVATTHQVLNNGLISILESEFIFRSLEMMGLAIVYGGVMTAYNATYRNFTDDTSKSDFIRQFKKIAVGIPYSFMMIAIMNGEEIGQKIIASVNLVESTAILLGIGASVIAHSWISKITKQPWENITRFRREFRLNTGDINIKLLNKKFSWSRSNVENQLIYLIPWTISLASLFVISEGGSLQIPGTDIVFSLMIPGLNFVVPFVHLASMPIALLAASFYSKWEYENFLNKFNSMTDVEKSLSANKNAKLKERVLHLESQTLHIAWEDFVFDLFDRFDQIKTKVTSARGNSCKVIL